MKKIAIVLGVVILALLGVVLFYSPAKNSVAPEEHDAVASADGRATVSSPLSGTQISSPVKIFGTVTGGGWFFEGSFPVKVLDADGTLLGKGAAQAQGDWMSTSTIAFSAEISFTKPRFATGTIVVSNDNPSGDPAKSQSFSVPVRFADVQTPSNTVQMQSGIRGLVALSPTCPVMRTPPDPACAPKPYATTISISKANLTTVIATAKSNASGTFSVALPVGEYMLQAKGGSAYPQCSPATVTVTSKTWTSITINCDTGIR